jgi:hypothetical protein
LLVALNRRTYIPEKDTAKGDEQTDQNGRECASGTPLGLLQHQTHDEITSEERLYEREEIE